MTFPFDKPTLFIYHDGRIKHTGRVFPTPYVVEAELWPNWALPITAPLAPLPILHRKFHFVGVAGPYAVYAEV